MKHVGLQDLTPIRFVAPKAIDGQLVTCVAMGVDVLARLHQQIQQVLVGLRDARQGKPKG